MAMDYSRLRGRIREKVGTEGALALAIGRSHSFLSAALNGRTEFEQTDIWAICEMLDIPQTEVGDYFFKQKSAET